MTEGRPSCLTRPDSSPSPAYVFVYELSAGLSPFLSKPLLGKYIPGIYHCSIVYRGKEVYFGRKGIIIAKPGSTCFGTPVRIFNLGISTVPQATFKDWLAHQRVSDFVQSKYHLLRHNCNTFANQCALFLSGSTIPHEILVQSKDLLNAPNGPILGFLVDIFESA